MNTIHTALIENAEAALQAHRDAFDALVSTRLKLIGSCHAVDEYRVKLKLPPTMTGSLDFVFLVLSLPSLPSVMASTPSNMTANLSTPDSFTQFKQAARICVEALEQAQRAE